MTKIVENHLWTRCNQSLLKEIEKKNVCKFNWSLLQLAVVNKNA